MKVVLTDGITPMEVLYLVCQSFIIVLVSFIHPWLAPNVQQKTRRKMQNNVVLTFLFVFSIAFAATSKIYQAMIIAFLFFYIKAMLLRYYA